MRPIVMFLSTMALLLTVGCRAWLVDRADSEVYDLIARGQHHTLGTTSDARIGEEGGQVNDTSRMYGLNPRPVDPAVPEEFRITRKEPVQPADATEVSLEEETSVDEGTPTSDDAQYDAETASGVESEAIGGPEMSPDIFSVEQRENILTFGLRDSLAYAMKQGRSLQNAKEDLYLAALDLSLERHLWTPQFSASMQADYQNFEETDDTFDRALSAVSEAAVTQRLPLGGELSAKIIHSLMREVGDHVSKGETGQMILSASIPLLRGAGRTAYESRYEAERELVYAVRRYERFRRSFLVEVAAEYFNLQQAKAAIANTYTSYKSRMQAWEKAEAFQRLGKSRNVFEAPRAKSNLRRAESALVSAKETYESALDQFKIRIGMPVDALLDVVGQDEDEESQTLDTLLPDVDETTAVEIALDYRLDLLNDADRVDDAKRGVAVARNRILPDLDLTAGATFDSDSDQLRPLTFRRERTTWQGGVALRVDDRKTERNAFRSSLVLLRRAERDYEISLDTVHAEVRRALRRITEKADLRMIQTLNVEENVRRLEAANAQFDLGRSTNQDLVDAEDDLLSARNQYAAAVASYRIAILELRRDTGTLRLTDEGRWDTEVMGQDAGGFPDGP